MGPEVKRRQRVAPPPCSSTGPISSTVQLNGWAPAMSAGGVAVSGGYRPLAGFSGATNDISSGGTALRSGNRAILPLGLATGPSSLERRRNEPSLTSCGTTLTVQVPAAGLVTKASASKALEVVAVPATAPDGSISSSSKVLLRIGVSIATRSR